MNPRRRPAVPIALLLAVVLLAACGGGKAVSGGGPGGSKPSQDPAEQEADDAAKALLLQGNRAGNRYYPEAGDTYEGFDAAAAAEIDPEITWLDGTEPAVGEVSILEADKTNLHLMTLSEGGLWFCLRTVNQFGRGEYGIDWDDAFEDLDEATECVQSGVQ